MKHGVKVPHISNLKN